MDNEIGQPASVVAFNFMEYEEIEATLRSGAYNRELKWLGKPTSVEQVKQAEAASSFNAWVVLQELVHHSIGVQMRVQKELSDDLILSDMANLSFNDIPLPAKSLEVFFEDANLPSVLVTKCNANDIERQLKGLVIGGNREDQVMCRMDQRNGSGPPVIVLLNLRKDNWDEIFNQGVMPNMAHSHGLNESENACIREMLRLAVKVFAYACLPRYRPAPAGIITRAMGGKVGYQGRPSRPTIRVVYMPSVHTIRPGYVAPGDGPKREWKGRRGFFMVFRHDRYKNMKGKMIYVAPTRVEGEQTLLIARKPK